LRKAFAEAVEDYLKTCDKLGREPDRPYSGQFRLRLSPETHAKAAIAAAVQGKSLNVWVAEMIEKGLRAA